MGKCKGKGKGGGIGRRGTKLREYADVRPSLLGVVRCKSSPIAYY